MLNDPSPERRLTLLRRALLAFAVLASAATTAVVGFAAYLFTQGYSGGSDPQSVAALAFPLSFLVLTVVGMPAALACAALWSGYLAVARRSRRSSGVLRPVGAVIALKDDGVHVERRRDGR
jgi:lysylphosphatidylglycerol synthetase-like protein (DUF2156 family)